jgi:hypothetical protein
VERLSWTTASKGESQELVRVKTCELRDASLGRQRVWLDALRCLALPVDIVWTESFALGWGY